MKIGAFSPALRAVLPLVLLLSAVLSGFLYGLGAALLVLAFGALLLTIALLYKSLLGLTAGDELTLEQALSLAAPTAEEEQKRAVLRALKDLEYERSVGKVSEEDYQELSQHYRAEAKRLIQSVDAELAEERARVRVLLEKRVARQGAHTDATAKTGENEARIESTGNGRDDRKKGSAEPAKQRRSCPHCSKKNDLDAAFCKACGQPLNKEGETLCLSCPAVFSRADAVCPDCGTAPVGTDRPKRAFVSET